MKRHILGLAAAAFFALGAPSVWAQPTQDSGPSRPGGPAGGGGGGGGAAGGGGGGTASGVASGGGSSSSTPSGSAGTSSSSGWGDTRSGGGAPRAEAPRRAPGYTEDGGQGRAVPRGSAGSGGQGRATPRGSAGNSGEGRAVPRGEGRGTASGRGATSVTIDGGGREPGQGRQRAPVPEYSRPRGNRTPVGTPVERTTEIRGGRGIGVGGFFDPYFGFGYGGYYGYYSRYANYWYPGYGFGLGYFYDPFTYGYGGYGMAGYGASPYYGGGGGGYYQSRGYDTGSLRLKVAPRDAKVYVDGYFVGVVDSFDGVFQKLAVEAGTHRVEIRADGFEPAQFEIIVTPGETITYKGELKRITP